MIQLEMAPIPRVCNLSAVKVGIIGCGNMGEAIFRQVRKQPIGNLWVNDSAPERRSYLENEYKIPVVTNYDDEIPRTNVLFLCVKPNQMRGICESLSRIVTPKNIIVSAAAGITHSNINSWLFPRDKLSKRETEIPIIRSAPNLPICVNSGVMAFHPNSDVDLDQRTIVKAVTQNIPQFWLRRIEDESLIDIITAISGCGPAFTSYYIDSLIQIGERFGLDHNIARKLALSTVSGTAKMLDKAKLHPDLLIRQVSSPGGATEAGMKILKTSEFKDSLETTVLVAYKRILEISKS